MHTFSLKFVVALYVCVVGISAQKVPTAIFAVLDSGKYIEPIGKIDQGVLKDISELPNFGKLFYTPKTSYTLIFASGVDGKAIVSKSLIGTECGGRTAEVDIAGSQAKLTTFVMALATNAQVKKAPSTRRLPTADERAEIEAIVRAEFKSQKVPSSAVKLLHYHNLTAVDVDRDGKVELIGSYWAAPNAKDRRLLFFVAESTNGKYSFTMSHYEALKPSTVMSGDMKDVDNGILHELLIDTFDYDSDGVAEIFTTTQAFEGRNFQVYRRTGNGWTEGFKSYNYRCGY
jgi:hypothetical protein